MFSSPTRYTGRSQLYEVPYTLYEKGTKKSKKHIVCAKSLGEAAAKVQTCLKNKDKLKGICTRAYIIHKRDIKEID